MENRIRELRKAAGLRQEDLARELGVPQSEITKSGGASKIIVGTNKDSL